MTRTWMATETTGEHPDDREEIGGGEQCPACLTYSYATDRYCACCGRQLRIQCPSCAALVFASADQPCPICGLPLGG